jgi:hypothetical protein
VVVMLMMKGTAGRLRVLHATKRSPLLVVVVQYQRQWKGLFSFALVVWLHQWRASRTR